MVEAGAKEVTKTRWSTRSSARTRRSRTSSPASTSWRRRSARPKLPGREEGDRRTTFYARSRSKVLGAARRRDAHQGQARELRHRRQGPRRARRQRCPDDDVAAAGRREADLQGARRRRSCATRSSSAASASTAASSTRSGRSTIEVGVLPRTHGSAVFTRGETQALVTATLGTADDQQKIETSTARPASASCSTTTSRRSRSAK